MTTQACITCKWIVTNYQADSPCRLCWEYDKWEIAEYLSMNKKCKKCAIPINKYVYGPWEIWPYCPECWTLIIDINCEHKNKEFRGKGEYPKVFYRCPDCGKKIVERHFEETTQEYYDYNMGA